MGYGQRSWILALALAGAGAAIASGAHAETVTVYSAGSLRGVVAALAAQAKPLGIDVQATFDGAGALRARIDRGEAPDLFLSADMASPDALAAAGRLAMPPIAFARNRLCLVAPRALGLTAASLVDTLLRPAVRVKTGTPKLDPAGDYAMALFDRIDRQRPGAGATLRGKATQQQAASGTAAALLLAQRVDVVVTYCSAVADLAKAVPDLVSVVVPPALDPHPLYGMALLSPRPDAMRLALLLLSTTGQAAVAQAGLIALAP